MKTAFYTAAVGADSQQAKMGVLANNMANAETNGYKSKNAVFADLMYTNMEADGRGRKGHSVRLAGTESTMRQEGALEQTGGSYDFAIDGDGFFAVLNPDTDQVSYTRNGRFQLSNEDGVFYLTDSLGRQVLDKDESPIEFFQDGDEGGDVNLLNRIGIYKVPIVDGMTASGMGAYEVTDKNGDVAVQDASDGGKSSTLRQGMLESSNVDMTKELSEIMEAQRAYQMALKMIQTSDELEQLENELRR